ncbi:uncharacterized protein LOC134852919 isoform X2 [Symsagittifera roscoffensis]|uniref:uncharacterized protein LOC134852919 isoform X2 n=1 Tax=Symsagittifera roscoffensis TaxID=84072 RepID=UPI00307B2197
MQIAFLLHLILIKVLFTLGQEYADDDEDLVGSGSGDILPDEPGVCGYGYIVDPSLPQSCLKGAKVHVAMIFDKDFDDELLNEESETYKREKSSYEETLFTIYSGTIANIISVRVTALKPGSVIVEHEVNQYLQDKVDLSQATTRLINQVTEIGSDPATRKHFQISSVEVFPVKSSYRVKFVLDSNLGGAGLPDEKALQAIQKYLSTLRPKGNFVSDPFYATRDRLKDTVTVYGLLQLPENAPLTDYQVEARRSNLYFYEINELPPSTNIKDPSLGTTPVPDDPKSPNKGGLLGNPAILAAIISGVLAGVFCLVLIAVFIICRMRKRDTGSIELEMTKDVPPHLNLNGNGGADPRNMYMYNKPACREIYA